MFELRDHRTSFIDFDLLKLLGRHEKLEGRALRKCFVTVKMIRDISKATLLLINIHKMIFKFDFNIQNNCFDNLLLN